MISVLGVTASKDANLWSDLLSVVGYGLLAGVGLSLLFSVAIRGLVTGAGARREGRTGAAVAWSTVGVVAVAGCLCTVVLGVVTMLHR
ncbi:MAG: hypothetical protein J7513_02940 [Solirubrobacteraceae bacterium]|nr:hypothetical protein [Solirubrobacteraceae bacterium]